MATLKELLNAYSKASSKWVMPTTTSAVTIEPYYGSDWGNDTVFTAPKAGVVYLRGNSGQSTWLTTSGISVAIGNSGYANIYESRGIWAFVGKGQTVSIHCSSTDSGNICKFFPLLGQV